MQVDRSEKRAGQHLTPRSFHLHVARLALEATPSEARKFCRSHIAKILSIRTQIFFSIARQYKRTRRTRRGADRGMITKIFRHFYISSFSYKDPVSKTPQESEHTGASCSLGFKIKPRRGHCKSSICRVIEVYFSSLFFFSCKNLFLYLPYSAHFQHGLSSNTHILCCLPPALLQHAEMVEPSASTSPLQLYPPPCSASEEKRCFRRTYLLNTLWLSSKAEERATHPFFPEE